jgi:hypothetical protein
MVNINAQERQNGKIKKQHQVPDKEPWRDSAFLVQR